MKRLFHTGAILVFMLFSASMTLAQSRYCQVDPGGTSIQVKKNYFPELCEEFPEYCTCVEGKPGDSGRLSNGTRWKIDSRGNLILKPRRSLLRRLADRINRRLSR